MHIVHIYRCPLMSIRGGQRLVILIIKLPHFFSIKLPIKHFILHIPYEEFLHENPCYHYSVFHKIKTGFFNSSYSNKLLTSFLVLRVNYVLTFYNNFFTCFLASNYIINSFLLAELSSNVETTEAPVRRCSSK